jgi:hypothetical protein
MTKKEKAVDRYIRDKHTQDECIGFIDGYEVAEKKCIPAVYWVLSLGMLIGGLIVACFTI